MAQQIFAKLKKTSKYYNQKRPGERFEVHVEQQGEWEYVVHNAGNDYRLSDVDLFVVGADGRELKIS